LFVRIGWKKLARDPLAYCENSSITAVKNGNVDNVIKLFMSVIYEFSK
jgi:hypothetical protein